MAPKKKMPKDSGGLASAAQEEGVMITDPRFSSAHTDPKFRKIPRRDSKVAIDSRFKSAFTDKTSAPVDKRGKRRTGGSGKDSLKEFYRIEDEEEEEEDKEKQIIDMKSDESSDTESEEEGKTEKTLVASSDDESAESEDEELSDDEAIFEDGPEIPEEEITNIEKETHRLAIVNMDWRHVSAKDLYVVLNSFVPNGGSILSVSVYPTEFGLERMKEEEIHGPAIDGNTKKEDEDEDEDEDEEEDEDEINQKLRTYEISRLKYYHAVAVCDSVATADFLYKSCDGVEFERSSIKLDLRFIPDSMEFKHPPRDTATQAPVGYEGLDFQSRALQMSKVNLTWDEDEPQRVKTLNKKFTPEQLADLEFKEYLASDEGESDDEEEGISRGEKYRALVESEAVDSDKEEGEEDDRDMEVTFNTGLEDLSKEILKKKEQKSETVWEAQVRKTREKKRARKEKQKDNSSSSDDDDYNDDQRAVKDDDFFMEEPSLKKKKTKKKSKKVLEEEVAEEERSRAELELLLADEKVGDGKGLKGYNIKRKGKKGKIDDSDDKIPSAPLDSRFSAALTSPDFALDPTDPQFKRSATYVRQKQIAQKQNEDPKSHEEEEVRAKVTKRKEELMNSDGNLGYEMSSIVKSLKRKTKELSKTKEGNAESSSTQAHRTKTKVKKALSKK